MTKKYCLINYFSLMWEAKYYFIFSSRDDKYLKIINVDSKITWNESTLKNELTLNWYYNFIFWNKLIFIGILLWNIKKQNCKNMIK